ncbi:MAG: hypothetical protein HPY66_3433 [Firmicutes bacterium]|nr:hypothetical protein [Bacillota bacterium]MDI6705412.1 PilN domain-containing protein [Bacillota bacterium]
MRRDINLLPDRYRDARHRRKIERTRKAILATIILIAAAAVYLPIYMVNNLKNVSASVENQIVDKKDAANYRRVQEELRKEIERRNEIIEELRSNVLRWSGLIEEIGEQVPEGVALQSISYGEEDSVKIMGQAATYNLVAQFLVNLQNMETIEEANPVTIAQEESGLYGFDIKCIIQGGSDSDETQ